MALEGRRVEVPLHPGGRVEGLDQPALVDAALHRPEPSILAYAAPDHDAPAACIQPTLEHVSLSLSSDLGEGLLVQKAKVP
jgi:hypothetical protein